MDEIVQMKVNEAIADERALHRKTEQELMRTKEYLKQVERRREELEAKNLDYDDRVRDLRNELDLLEGNTGSEALQQKMGIIKELKDDKRKMLQDLNEMSANLEDVLAENRILRKMNNIPDNWGCEPQKRIIKLQDRETVFEYKRLVKILQEDNYNLEKERARLKHRLKQLAIYSGMSKDEKYKDLTPEQVIRLNEFLIRLRGGDVEDDRSTYDLLEENKALKKELEVLQTKGYNVIKQQLEIFFKENKGSLFAGMNFDSKPQTQDISEEQKRFMDTMRKQQEQMRGLVENIWGGMAGGTIATNLIPQGELTIAQEEAGRFGPPRVTGIGTGYSSKFNTNLSVPMAGAANPKDIPGLQLQVIELFALNDRKDSQIKMLESELERAYTRVRRYLLMQDQLYLNYAEELQGFKDKCLKNEENLSKAKDELREEQIKNENYRKAIRSLKLDPDSRDQELVNLQKKLALVEVDNFKLAKKYAIIFEQEKQLREAYHKIEEGFTERERFATERISSLKEWQIKAINEIKFLYSKFRDAIPLSEYQAVAKDLFIYKQKFADMMEKTNRQIITNSRLQTENRELLTAGEKVKLYEEFKIDTENELEVIKKRLELVDPLFKWENAVFNKVVIVLKQKRISPRQIFDHFDKDQSGKLSNKEFLNALDKMGISDLNAKEREMLLRSIDADMDGTVDYREFCRKCGRFGVVSRSREDEIVFIIDETLKRNNLELSEMFEMMDKKGKGVITKEDFKDTLINARVKLERKDLENFVDLFWKGKDEGINIRDFIKIYNKFKVRFEEEESNQGKTRGRLEVTDEMIERMKWIFDKLNDIFKKNGISLRDAFNRIDSSPDKKITRIELKRMFDHMGVTVRDNELEMIFRRMDFDDSGAITFLEFESEFNKIIETPVENLKAINSQSKLKTSAKFGSDSYTAVSEDYLLSEEVTNARKINILESKVKQYENKFEMYKGRLQKSENNQITWERDYDILEKKYLEVNEKYHAILEKEQATNAQLVGTLSKQRSEELVLKSERQTEQITDLLAAMDSYKSLFEVAASQAKTLKLSNRRARDEEENLMYALRELQSDSVDKLKLGRIYYILMLSRWQEAAIGMKYDYVLNDIRTLRNEYTSIEIRMKREEDSRHDSENKLREKSLQVEQLKQELHARTASGISMARAEEISKALHDIADEKSDVEEKYITIYSEMNNMKFKLSEYESRLEHSESMLYILKNSTESEVSDKLIEMSDKLSQIRRNELRCKREAEEYQEKATYSEKRVGQQKKTIVDLEDQLADLESSMHRKEEEWRRADNDRQKKFFEQQFITFETEKRYKGYAEDDPIELDGDKFKREDLVRPPVGEFLIKKSDVRIMQAKLRNANEEITSLQAQIQSKDKQLDRLREWQLEDKLLSEDEKMRDIIESNKVKIDEMHEKESKEMAQAAFKTIKTLQELVENKNNQNKRKEEIIKEMKDRMAEQKQADTREIVRLNDELSKALRDRADVDYAFRETHISREHKEYEAVSRRELERLLYQKDDEIENLANQIASLRREKEYLLDNKDAAERDTTSFKNDDLNNKSTKRIRALQKDVDRLTKQLHDKQKIEDRLNDSIKQITDKLVRLEEMKGITDEDLKMDKLTKSNQNQDSRLTELEKMLKAKERRLTTTSAKCKTLEKDNKELKETLLKNKETEQELREEIKNGLVMRQKLIDTHQKEKLEAKRKARHDKKDTESKIEGGSDLELKSIIRDLEREIKNLKSSQKPMVAYNGQTSAFEYIGEPVPLKDKDVTCENIGEILKYAKEWLKVNDRLTVSSIFNSFDYNKSGFIEQDLLVPIFARMGVKLYKKECDIIYDCLDKDEMGMCRYKPLVLELTTGPRQIEFIPDFIVSIGKEMLKNDVDSFTLLQTIDKNKFNFITLDELKAGIEELFGKGVVSNKNIDDIFNHFKNPDSVEKMNAEAFTNEARDALLALIVGQVKKVIEEKSREYSKDVRDGNMTDTKGLNIDTEFSRIDPEHDGFLKFSQFNELLDKYNFEDIKTKCRAEFMDLIDKEKKSIISLAYFKVILDLPRAVGGQDAHFALEMNQAVDDFRRKEDEDIENNARKALRRIYQNNNLLDRLHKQLKVYDLDQDGVMSRSSLHQSIIDVTKDVHEDDINAVVQYADKRNKGYFNPDHFFEHITRVAQDEAKNDAILRRLGNVLRHKGIDLEKELMKQSRNNTGVVDTYDFNKTLRELRIGLDSNDMDELVNFASQGEKFIEIKWFIKKVDEALNSKPITVTAPKMQSKVVKSGVSEKEYKKIQSKLQVLTNQLNDAKRELEKVEKNAQDWKIIAEKNEKSLNILSDKLMDSNDKSKKLKELKGGNVPAKYLKLQVKQQERILELDNKVLELQYRNEELEKEIEVNTKVKVMEHETVAKDAKNQLRALKSENLALQSQMDKLIDANTPFEKSEEAEYAKQMHTKSLENRIKDLEKDVTEQYEELLKAEHKNLDMKYDRENYQNKISTLKDKIDDLETYCEIKLEYMNLTKAGFIGKDGKVDTEAALKSTAGLNKRSNEELMKIIEGLKRVINTQKTEMDELKKQASKFKPNDKVSTNKQLKDEISNLEEELKTFEKKENDVEVNEYKVKVDKLTNANRALMNDIDNEQKRYEFLEAKYKELLVKYNVACKDLEKKQDSLFSMSTGANRATYQEYLEHKKKMQEDGM